MDRIKWACDAISIGYSRGVCEQSSVDATALGAIEVRHDEMPRSGGRRSKLVVLLGELDGVIAVISLVEGFRLYVDWL